IGHALETRVFAIFFESAQEADAATVLIPMDTSPGSEVYAEQQAIALNLDDTSLVELPGR
ncbi:MAG: hypothetical protein OXT09_14115, partial [Myxococcales bacterium]|nr:hypothetical protein [Myxococcales bacterium]